jgi:YHS domain-containing protein
MKTKLTIILVLLLAAGLTVRAEDKKTELPKDTYPLETCVVSGDKLDSMDDLIKYTYKAPDGKEREVRFCCKGCIKDFKKDPAKYLKLLDEAAAKKAATKPDTK